MGTDLRELTSQLGERYKQWKDSEKEKNETKKVFFEAATEQLQEQEFERRVIQVYGPTEAEARARLAKHHPTMIVKVLEENGDGEFEAIVEPDPIYEPYTFVNPDDGMVYSRQISAGKLELDEDLILELEPDLYERVTFIPEERQLRPLEDLAPEDMAAIADYIYEGKPTVKLGAPRKAKPEEIE